MSTPTLNAPTLGELTGSPLSFTTWDEWNESALLPPNQPPVLPESPAAWRRQLTSSTVHTFDRLRKLHHNQLQPIHTAEYQELYDEVADQLEDNEGREPARPGSLLIGPPAAGKSCLVRNIGRVYTRERLLDAEAAGVALPSRYIPCVYVTVPSTTTLLGFNQVVLNFMGMPTYGTKDATTIRIINAAKSTHCELFLIDDVNAIRTKTNHGQELAQHIKHLMSSIAGTFVFAGTEAADAALLHLAPDVQSELGSEFDQTAGRIVRRVVPPMRRNDTDRDEQMRWAKVVATFEQAFLLRDHEVGQLHTPDMLQYLHDRTQGYMGALSQLLMRGANRAIRTKTEQVTYDVLRKVRLDVRAEKEYQRKLDARKAA